MTLQERALKLHEDHKGKIEVISKVSCASKEDLSLAYSPGVAEPCVKISKNKDDVYKYTAKGNMIAIITDGSAVLGLGNIGPEAALPVMEGKAILFKTFANVDAFPICLDTQDTEEIIRTAKLIAPGFGGINLEDISAPRCFEIEKRLQAELNIPVFHDDQHGTAIVTLAGLINALKVVKKSIRELKIIINGGGAAGQSIADLLLEYGAKNIIVCDRAGAISRDNPASWKKDNHEPLSQRTNPYSENGSLADVFKKADVFIGVSGPNMVTKEMVKTMARDPIVFAMANPTPEIMPDIAKAGGARIVGTGRSDFPNQVNNVLAFPGIFRGALDSRATAITREMYAAAAEAIANSIPESELRDDYIIPNPFDKAVPKFVAAAIAKVVEKSRK
ncbi:MAG: NADP-dependent malic enzyme [Fusobacteria bacterium]|nr:NADP-dependent malic enzyme [Fusobacteriota bacterium]